MGSSQRLTCFRTLNFSEPKKSLGRPPMAPMLPIAMIGIRHVPLFVSMTGAIEHIRAGTLRPLVVTTATRSELLPDIPTVGEFVPGLRGEHLVRRRRAEKYNQ